jgi:protein-disulfide isomerase
MKTPAKVTIIVIAALIALGIGAILITMMNQPTAPAPESSSDGALPGTRSNTHVLDDAGADAPTLVEFLDFECEACGGLYPVIEQVREQYRGDINFAIRYFPIPSHLNSMNAAIAVEAAAQQGQVEEMYSRMFETQAEWGEKQTSEAERFRGFAEELGLDMDAFDSAVADPETQARVEMDYAEGLDWNVEGTPTFFLDGEKLELTQLTDLTDALDRAIAG